MLVSILVLFFRRRLMPSMPMPGEPRAPGLDMAWSDVRFSAQTAQTQSKGPEVKTRHHQDSRDKRHWTRETARRAANTFGEAQGQTCIIKPLFQQWLEFAHVLKAQVQGLEARYSSLAEVISIQLPHGQANVPLSRGGEEKC